MDSCTQYTEGCSCSRFQVLCVFCIVFFASGYYTIKRKYVVQLQILLFLHLLPLLSCHFVLSLKMFSIYNANHSTISNRLSKCYALLSLNIHSLIRKIYSSIKKKKNLNLNMNFLLNWWENFKSNFMISFFSNDDPFELCIYNEILKMMTEISCLHFILFRVPAEMLAWAHRQYC